MQSAIEKLKERHAREVATLEAETAILALLPDDLPSAPTISNTRTAEKDDEPLAWLSFSGPSYDPDNTHNPVAILAALERAGFESVPLTLCQWGNYRRSPYPARLEDVPEEKGGSFGSRDKLTDTEAIAPIWITPEQHTGAEARCYLRKDGKLFKVSVKVPSVAYLTAERTEYRGGWSFKRGTAHLHFPGWWHGHQHCTLSQHSRAWVDTEQGISGAVYFMPHDEQDAWPLKASEFLASLLKQE